MRDGQARSSGSSAGSASSNSYASMFHQRTHESYCSSSSAASSKQRGEGGSRRADASVGGGLAATKGMDKDEYIQFLEELVLPVMKERVASRDAGAGSDHSEELRGLLAVQEMRHRDLDSKLDEDLRAKCRIDAALSLQEERIVEN